MLQVAIGRASSRRTPIGSLVSSQIAVGAVLDAPERGVDLGDQLALAIAGAQLERPIGLHRGAIGDVGLEQALFLEVVQGLGQLLQELIAPAQQLLAEILALHGS